MTTPPRERLYGLLPALYRIRDAEEGQQALRAFLALVEHEVNAIRGDIEGLYENWFIETCQEWVVPYLGDLLGVPLLRPVEAEGYSARAYVANTLAARRAKGTLALLEQLARDVTGHPARAAEFFRRLITAPNLNHLRPGATTTPDLRRTDALDLLGTPFDMAYRTPEVRRIEPERGRFNVPNVGLYLWPFAAYPLQGVTARAVLPGRFTFDPLGRDAPLFNPPDPEDSLTGVAEERHVPTPIRRRALFDELQALRAQLGALPPSEHDEAEADWARASAFFEPGRVAFTVEVQRAPGDPFEPVPPPRLFACHLESWRRPPALADPAADPIPVLVDPVLGRLTLPEGLNGAAVRVGYSYGFGLDVGGGPYDREADVDALLLGALPPSTDDLTERIDWQVGVSQSGAAVGGETVVPTLAQAVQLWNAQPPGTTGALVVMDSATYAEHLTGADRLTIPEGSTLLLLAAAWPVHEPADAPPERRVGEWDASTVRPLLLGNLSVEGTAPAGSDTPGRLLISGLAVQGRVRVLNGHLGNLHLSHCTVSAESVGGALPFALAVPPSAAESQGNAALDVRLDGCICGPVGLAASVPALTVRHSILDRALGTTTEDPQPVVEAPGSATLIQDSTLFGAAEVYELNAAHTLFTRPLTVERRQQGCLRYCYVAPGSATPRRYRCQPDREADARVEQAEKKAGASGAVLTPSDVQAIRARAALDVVPHVTSRRFGDAGYAHLRHTTPDAIRKGGEGGTEMGAYHPLGLPVREANLRAVLDEYLRLGLEAGLLFVP